MQYIDRKFKVIVRPTRHEMTATERIVYYSQLLRGRGTSYGTRGSLRGSTSSQEVEGEGGGWERAFIVVSTGRSR